VEADGKRVGGGAAWRSWEPGTVEADGTPEGGGAAWRAHIASWQKGTVRTDGTPECGGTVWRARMASWQKGTVEADGTRVGGGASWRANEVLLPPGADLTTPRFPIPSRNAFNKQERRRCSQCEKKTRSKSGLCDTHLRLDPTKYSLFNNSGPAVAVGGTEI
jgi:hypothetical protein